MALRASILALALCSPLAVAQETAGRVLVAAGEVSIERGQQKIAARAGTEVLAGDTLQLGPQSNAQVRLTDESIIALRPDTTFRLTEYAFRDRKPEEQRSIFNLLKGGMRTVTGIIGRAQRRNYAVRTPNATIGIRGTHYTVVHCVGDCGVSGQSAQANAQLAALMLVQSDAGAPGIGPPGVTFGAVTEGNIAASNQSGVHEIGPDQYFRVASPTSPAELLLGPPAALGNPAASILRPGPKPSAGAGSATAGTVALTGSGGLTGDIDNSATVNGAPVPTLTTTSTISEAPDHASRGGHLQFASDATANGFFNAVQATGATGTVFYRLDGGVTRPALVNGAPSFVTVDFINVGVNLGLGVARFSLGIRGDDGGRINIAIPSDIPLRINNGQLTFTATLQRSDFPLNQLAFRCETCDPNGGVGFFNTVSVRGTISGSSVSVEFSGTDQSGDTGAFRATLERSIPPNDLAAAMVIPRQSGGANVLTTSSFGVQVDGAGAPTALSGGLLQAQRGAATNTIVDSAGQGQLIWGKWIGPGAQIRDASYNNFLTPASGADSFQPWIVGQIPNTVPVTLGSVTYSPIGGVINNGFATLNSASMTADFVGRTMSVNISATRTSGELNTLTMSGSSGFSPINATFGAAFSSVQCSGPCTTGGSQLGGSFGGFFAGPKAEGAGVAFAAGYAIANGVSGVIAFKR